MNYKGQDSKHSPDTSKYRPSILRKQERRGPPDAIMCSRHEHRRRVPLPRLWPCMARRRDPTAKDVEKAVDECVQRGGPIRVDPVEAIEQDGTEAARGARLDMALDG